MEYDRTAELRNQTNWGYRPKPFVSVSGEYFWVWNFIEKEILLFNKNEIVCSVCLDKLQGNYTVVSYHAGDSQLILHVQSYGFDDYHNDVSVILFYDAEKNTITYSIGDFTRY
jgi:hypothetical protein